jgi:hypothetical protein
MADNTGSEVESHRERAVERLRALTEAGVLVPIERDDRIRRVQSALTRAGIGRGLRRPARPLRWRDACVRLRGRARRTHPATAAPGAARGRPSGARRVPTVSVPKRRVPSGSIGSSTPATDPAAAQPQPFLFASEREAARSAVRLGAVIGAVLVAIGVVLSPHEEPEPDPRLGLRTAGPAGRVVRGG